MRGRRAGRTHRQCQSSERILSAGWRSPSRSAIKSRAAFPQGARKAGLYLVVLSCLVSEPEAVANGLSVVAGFEVNVQRFRVLANFARNYLRWLSDGETRHHSGA